MMELTLASPSPQSMMAVPSIRWAGGRGALLSISFVPFFYSSGNLDTISFYFSLFPHFYIPQTHNGFLVCEKSAVYSCGMMLIEKQFVQVARIGIESTK